MRQRVLSMTHNSLLSPRNLPACREDLEKHARLIFPKINQSWEHHELQKTSIKSVPPGVMPIKLAV